MPLVYTCYCSRAVGNVFAERIICQALYFQRTTLHASNNQLLKVQLGGNTHEHIHVQVIVVSDERSGGSTTSNSVHKRGFDLGEVTAVEVLTNEADNLSASAESLARLVVHNKIKVTLAEALLLVLETVVLGGNSVQTRGQENDFGGEDGKFTIITVLGVGLANETGHTDDITTTEELVLLLEGLSSRILGGAHDLDLDTLSADIVEDQLATSGTLGVNTATEVDNGIGPLLALLETLVVLQDVAQVGVNLELVGVRVGLLGLAELVDSLAANLEVLL